MKAFTIHQFAILCLTAAAAVGQQVQPDQAQQQPGTARPAVRQPAQQGQVRQAVQGQHERSLDSLLADCFIGANQHEVALLKMGLEKTQNEQVKQLAQQMIQDHEQNIEKLAKFASKSHAHPTDQARAPKEARPADAATPPVPAEAPDSANKPKPAATEVADNVRIQQRANKPVATDATAASDDLIGQMQKIEEAAAEECLRLTKAELEKHEGVDFDKAFLGQQIGMHLGMIAKLNASQKAVSGEFQQLVQASVQKTEEHKQHLEHLMGQLKDKEPGDAAQRKPAAEPRPAAQPRPAEPRQQ